MTTQEFKYGLLEAEDYDKAVRHVLTHFAKHEKTCKFLGLSVYPDHEQEMEDYLYDVVRQGLSVVAKHPDTDEIVGVVLNSEKVKESEPEQTQVEPQREKKLWHKFYAVYAQNQSAIDDIFTHFDVDRYFYIYMLSVHPEFGGRGIATALVEKSVELALERGLKLLVVDATAEQTKHICVNKLGFLVLGEMKFKDFVWNGDKVLDEIDENETMQLVAKRYD